METAGSSPFDDLCKSTEEVLDEMNARTERQYQEDMDKIKAGYRPKDRPLFSIGECLAVGSLVVLFVVAALR